MAPVAVRSSARRSVLPAVQVRAFKETPETKGPAAPADKKDAPAPAAADQEVAAPPQDAAPLARGGLGADLAAAPYRVASLFDEMEREMAQLTRAFGFGDLFPARRAGGLFGRAGRADPFEGMLSAAPQMAELRRLAADVGEDDKAYTIKADVPGM